MVIECHREQSELESANVAKCCDLGRFLRSLRPAVWSSLAASGSSREPLSTCICFLVYRQSRAWRRMVPRPTISTIATIKLIRGFPENLGRAEELI